MNIETVKCKYCGGNNIKRYGHYNGEQLWWCDDCKRKQTGKDTLFKMRFPSNQIATALRLYYAGLSLDNIQEEFQHQFNIHVATSTLYEWIQEFTNEAIKRAKEFKPVIGDEWMADETAIVVKGKPQKGKKQDRYYWLFDVIDTRTRFLLATHISPIRSLGDVEKVMNQAAITAGKVPARILTDGMKSYPEGIRVAFNGKVQHIQADPFEKIGDTNIVERFHGTLKDRIKILRGFKSVDTAKQILDGWLVYYNFFRPHESLNSKSPAQNMEIALPFNDWQDIVRHTKKRIIKPEVQTPIVPQSQRYFNDTEFRREYHREWYRKHHTLKRQSYQCKSPLSSITSLRRPKP
jgi:transposase-like protein